MTLLHRDHFFGNFELKRLRHIVMSPEFKKEILFLFKNFVCEDECAICQINHDEFFLKRGLDSDSSKEKMDEIIHEELLVHMTDWAFEGYDGGDLDEYNKQRNQTAKDSHSFQKFKSDQKLSDFITKRNGPFLEMGPLDNPYILAPGTTYLDLYKYKLFPTMQKLKGLGKNTEFLTEPEVESKGLPTKRLFSLIFSKNICPMVDVEKASSLIFQLKQSLLPGGSLIFLESKSHSEADHIKNQMLKVLGLPHGFHTNEFTSPGFNGIELRLKDDAPSTH